MSLGIEIQQAFPFHPTFFRCGLGGSSVTGFGDSGAFSSFGESCFGGSGGVETACSFEVPAEVCLECGAAAAGSANFEAIILPSVAFWLSLK
jgi:hypothetical protein